VPSTCPDPGLNVLQRKMMCIVVLVSRLGVHPNIVDEVLLPLPAALLVLIPARQLLRVRKVVIPKMPALGLLLEYPIFGIYNRRIAETNDKLDAKSPERRAPIDFEAHRAEIDAFKQTHIYANMRAIEDRVGL
jgi:tRNA pseudouridine38-40 synthase